MRKRTQARETALQLLYQYDLTGEENIDEFLKGIDERTDVQEYARLLVAGVVENLSELDAQIARVSENWRLNRTAAVDRCALRIGLYELLNCPEVPPKVAINEAIDLAKKFSAEQSGAFVNGILDKLYGQLRESGESTPGNVAR